MKSLIKGNLVADLPTDPSLFGKFAIPSGSEDQRVAIAHLRGGAKQEPSLLDVLDDDQCVSRGYTRGFYRDTAQLVSHAVWPIAFSTDFRRV